jgi:hypothetical protein
MAELPHPWGAYLRLQSQLKEHTCIDDLNWGLEAGLNSIVNTPKVAVASCVSDGAITRAVASEARRERHHAHLRRKHLVQSEAGHDPRQMLEARSNLRAIQSLVSASDWDLLVALGEGREYQELGAPGRLRVRVLRLRHDLRRDLSLAA